MNSDMIESGVLNMDEQTTEETSKRIEKVMETGMIMDAVNGGDREAHDYAHDNSLEKVAQAKLRAEALARLKLAHTPIKREFKKVGRNDECPCGSGKKYKHCCLSSGRFEKTIHDTKKK